MRIKGLLPILTCAAVLALPAGAQTDSTAEPGGKASSFRRLCGREWPSGQRRCARTPPCPGTVVRPPVEELDYRNRRLPAGEVAGEGNRIQGTHGVGGHERRWQLPPPDPHGSQRHGGGCRRRQVHLDLQRAGGPRHGGSQRRRANCYRLRSQYVSIDPPRLRQRRLHAGAISQGGHAGAVECHRDAGDLQRSAGLRTPVVRSRPYLPVELRFGIDARRSVLPFFLAQAAPRQSGGASKESSQRLGSIIICMCDESIRDHGLAGLRHGAGADHPYQEPGDYFPGERLLRSLFRHLSDRGESGGEPCLRRWRRRRGSTG